MRSDAALVLTTERLVLRRLRADEAGAVAEYKNDPDVARYQDWDLPYPVEDIAAKIAAYANRTWPSPGSGLNVAIEHRGELIGDVGVGWDDSGTEAEVGYTLRPEYQGGASQPRYSQRWSTGSSPTASSGSRCQSIPRTSRRSVR